MEQEPVRKQVTDDVDPMVPIDVIRPPNQRDHSDGLTLVTPSEPEAIVEAEIEDFQKNRKVQEEVDEE